MRKIKGLICLFLAALPLTGCWDRVELENRGFVITIGIDKKEEGDKPFAVSMAIANVGAISEKGGDGDKETVEQSESDTLAGAMHIIDSKISQKIYYGHTKLVVMGEEFLKDPDMLREALDALERNNELNQKVIVVAAEGKAADVLNKQAKNEALLGIYISNFYKNNQKNTAGVSKLDLEQLIHGLNLTGSAVIPQVKLEDKDLKLDGAGVIKDFKLCGWLSGEETKGLLWFKAQAKGTQVTTRHKEGDKDIPVAFTVTENSRKITFSEKYGKLVCHINLTVKGDIEEYKLLNPSLYSDNRIDTLQEEYKAVIAGQLNQTFEIFQKKYEADGFSLKEYIRKRNYPLYLKYEGDWDNAYSEMAFFPKVTVYVTNAGTVK